MDAILINDDLELKVYVLYVSEDVKQAHLLVTSFYGEGERAICIADINYQHNSIFNFLHTNPASLVSKSSVNTFKKLPSLKR